MTTPQDTVSIGGQANSAGGSTGGQSQESGSAQTGTGAQGSQPTGANGTKLTPDQQAEVSKLKETDRHVRQHEAAHQAAGGALTGAATFTYVTGPDGQQYAVGGEVGVSIPSVSRSNPAQSIQQLQQVVRAALAPSDPSGQDEAVAAQAEAEIAQAEAQATQQTQQKEQAAIGGGQTSDGGPISQSSGATDSPDGSQAQPPHIVGPPPFGAPKSSSDGTDATGSTSTFGAATASGDAAAAGGPPGVPLPFPAPGSAGSRTNSDHARGRLVDISA